MSYLDLYNIPEYVLSMYTYVRIVCIMYLTAVWYVDVYLTVWYVDVYLALCTYANTGCQSCTYICTYVRTSKETLKGSGRPGR